MNTTRTDGQDWDRLLDVWQGETGASTVPEPLVERVRSRVLRDALLIALEFAVVIGAFVVALREAMEHRSPLNLAWAFAVCWVAVQALDWSWRNYRRGGAPADASTAEYLRYLEARAAADVRALRVSWLLYGVMAVLVVGYAVAGALLPGAPAPAPGRIALSAGWIVVFGGGLLAWSRHVLRRVDRERAALREYSDAPAAEA